MSSHAVSLIRSAYQAVNDGRVTDWAAEHLPPSFELIPHPESPLAAAGGFTGPRGVSQFFGALAQAWAATRVEVDEVVDFGNRVVVLGRLRNRGRGSGMELDAVMAHVWTLDDGVPRRVEIIGDRDEALRRGGADRAS